MTADALPGTLGLVSDLFPDVMRHFIRHTSSSVENKTLLIMDNHESYLGIEALNIAKENGVIILTIPPHTSKLQPLDMSVYFPFKNFYNAAIQAWLLEHPGIPLTIF